MARFECYLSIVLIIFSSGMITTLGDPSQQHDDYPKLRFVSAVFRHGDRTLSRYESYPKDPHKDYKHPAGEGQLTNDGKRRAYEVGILLKKRYNDFLGDEYDQSSVYARSTAFVRCKMTLQLILAGLYPPAKHQKWHTKLAWQPVDTLYTPIFQDSLLLSMACPSYNKSYTNLLKTPTVKAEIKLFSNFMEKMTMRTGKNITNMLDLFFLYNTFATQSSLGLSLPKWTEDIFPWGRLKEACLLQYKLFNYNNELMKMNGGILLYRMIKDMNGVINGTSNRKINIFAAHDVTISAILYALGIFDENTPAFMSGVIVELHEKGGEYFVKVLHYLSMPPQIVELSILGCSILCPFDKFVELRSAVITAFDGEEPMCT